MSLGLRMPKTDLICGFYMDLCPVIAIRLQKRQGLSKGLKTHFVVKACNLNN